MLQIAKDHFEYFTPIYQIRGTEFTSGKKIWEACEENLVKND